MNETTQSHKETCVPSGVLLADSRVPRTCPSCGCQTRDPFRGEIVIHDVKKCSLKFDEQNDRPRRMARERLVGMARSCSQRSG